MLVHRLRFLIFMVLVSSAVSTIIYAQNNTQVQNIANALCNIIGTIAAVIGILAIFMFILGGVLYAFAHFLPAAGNIRGSMQGWGMGILTGGVIMLVLYLLAPFIVSQIASFSTGSNIPSITTPNCQCSGGVCNAVINSGTTIQPTGGSSPNDFNGNFGNTASV